MNKLWHLKTTISSFDVFFNEKFVITSFAAGGVIAGFLLNERKVRAPQVRMLDNVQAAQADGKCNRE